MDSTVNAVSIYCNLFVIVIIIILSGVGMWVKSFHLIISEVLISIILLLQLAMAKDPEAAFFKRLEGLQPCEVSELKSGTHIFAVYGVNWLYCSFIFLL